MIRPIDIKDIPPIQQQIRQHRPETAFARKQVAAFKESGLEAVEITDIPAAYNTTVLYGSIRDAINSSYPHYKPRPRVIRRGARLFISKERPWAAI